MRLIRSLLLVALVTPSATAGPRGNAFHQRIGDDDTGKDSGSSAISSPTAVNPSPTSSLVTLPSKDQPSSTPLKDELSITVSPLGPISSVSAYDKDSDTSTSFPSKDDKSSSSVPAKDQSSSTPHGTETVMQSTSIDLTVGFIQPTLSASFFNGTGIYSSPESTVEILTTDVVYTTLTTCLVTSTFTSGTKTTEEVTATISTVTHTSTSTVCTKCLAPPKSKPEVPLTSLAVTSTSVLPSFVVYSLTQPSAGLLSVSSKPEVPVLGTAIFSTKSLGFPSGVSSTAPVFSGSSSPLEIPGYGIVPSPTTIPGGEGPFSNGTSTTLPIFTPSLLGNAYGGGFVSTPSIYVTKLPFPNGPSKGVPPGYGFSSKPEASITATFASQSFGNTTNKFGSPTATATILSSTSGLSLVFGSSSIPAIVSASLVVISSGISPSSSTEFIASTSLIPFSSHGQSNLSFTLGGSSSEVGKSMTALSSLRATASLASASLAGEIISSTTLTGTEASGIGLSASSTAEGSNEIIVLSMSPFPQTRRATPAPSGVGGSQVGTELSSAQVSSGEIIVGTSSPAAVLVSQTISKGEIMVGTSTRSPALVTQSASNGEVTVGASTPSPFLVTQTASNGEVTVGFPTTSPVLVGQTTSIGEVNVGISTPSSVIVSQTTSNGQVTVEISTPSPILVSSVATSGEVIVQTSTPQPFLVSQTPSKGQVIVETSSPTPVLVSHVISTAGYTEGAVSPAVPTNGTLVSLASASPIVIGVLGSPISSPGQAAGAPITLASGSPVETAVLGNLVSSPGQLIGAPITSAAGSPVETAVLGSPGSTPGQPAIAPVTSAVGLPEQESSVTGQPSPTILTPIVGANGLTSLAVIPSPFVGANGLTSLAVFSTPVAAAKGLTSPAVILTPVVGANGLTSLAVLATPVVGANGLTSLAIGLEGEQGSAAGQSGILPSPIEGHIPVTPPGSGFTGQSGIPTPPLIGPSGASGILLPPSSSTSLGIGSGGNSSFHAPLTPSTIPQFEGSAAKASLSFGICLFGFVLFLCLL